MDSAIAAMALCNFHDDTYQGDIYRVRERLGLSRGQSGCNVAYTRLFHVKTSASVQNAPQNKSWFVALHGPI